MKKIMTLVFISVSIVLFTGCGAGFSGLADPKLVASGDYGPYPTNYKVAAKKAWELMARKKGADYYPETMTVSKPIKAYSRHVNGDPAIYGYFVRTCVKFKDGRQKNCLRLIVKKGDLSKYLSVNGVRQPYPGYDPNGAGFRYLKYDPFFKEPWYIREDRDIY